MSTFTNQKDAKACYEKCLDIVNEHYGSKGIVCPNCKRKKKTKGIRAHLPTCVGYNLFKCRSCSMAYSQNGDLINHVKREHGSHNENTSPLSSDFVVPETYNNNSINISASILAPLINLLNKDTEDFDEMEFKDRALKFFQEGNQLLSEYRKYKLDLSSSGETYFI